MDNVKDDAYYAKRILKNIEVLSRYLADKSQDDLLNDGFLCDAIENRFTKLSEDSSKLSASYKKSLPAIPWTGIYSIRNRICHDYDVVDAATLYKTVKVSFPKFRKELLGVLPCHQMTLYDGPFLAITSGRKTVEMRLYDEKRSLIKIGDLIVFENKDTHKEAVVEVNDLKVFSSFEELYASYSKQAIGYQDGEKADPRDMLLYYREEDIRKWGALAIGIKLY